jgi:hypothetical protein
MAGDGTITQQTEVGPTSPKRVVVLSLYVHELLFQCGGFSTRNQAGLLPNHFSINITRSAIVYII